MGVDRGFIFFDNGTGVPWRGLTDVEVSEDSYVIESYFIDGRRVGKRHYEGNFHAGVTSYDDPFADDETLFDAVTGFSYRETYELSGVPHYRLHIVHGAEIRYISSVRKTHNVASPEEATTFYWEVDSLDVELRETGLRGSHLILDSSQLFPWSVRDIENVLYDEGRIPSIDEMFEIFAEMNLVIIDHGNGTWSAVGHESMIKHLDPTEFAIESPTIEIDEVDPEMFDIYDLIRDERWLE